MLVIRLQRIGRKNMPTYRIVVSENAKDTQATHLENVGSYNPHNKANGLILKEDRIKYYLNNGVIPSDTVSNLLVKAGLIEADKKKSVYISKKRRTKLDIKNTEKLEKEKAKKVKEEGEKAETKKAEEIKKEVPVAEEKLAE